ncbi:MAG: hypothetical protein JNK26_02390 [Candidatus Doudnabacteria bacterium]|nr:hypothetical protein [Candidatus Doudnabacteria bacterium]
MPDSNFERRPLVQKLDFLLCAAQKAGPTVVDFAQESLTEEEESELRNVLYIVMNAEPENFINISLSIIRSIVNTAEDCPLIFVSLIKGVHDVFNLLVQADDSFVRRVYEESELGKSWLDEMLGNLEVIKRGDFWTERTQYVSGLFKEQLDMFVEG